MSAKLSIGLPIYNEVKFVEKTLDSILSQSFNFFEFIIVDNYSNDGTYELLKKYNIHHSSVTCTNMKGLLENI